MMAATPKMSKSVGIPGALPIASALRARRKRLGLTLQELADNPDCQRRSCRKSSAIAPCPRLRH